MITRRTRIQLVIFALITMVGVAYVGARYARLDRLFFDDTYRVSAHFAESGGIFEGAAVSYRGVTVGQVGELELTDAGVDVMLDIENDNKDIPADASAMVANGSAVGEQYVDLLPESDDGPFLRDGDEIALERTDTPIATTKLLVDLDRTVNSVNKKSLTTVIDELGKAFQGTGEDLGQIIDTSNSFIRTANANFDLTTDLLEDGNVVLSTQLDKASAIRSFAKDLSQFSDTLVRSDEDLRAVIEDGSATANQLRTFLEENQVDLGELINQLVTTGEITGKNIDGAETVLLVYPYVVAGGYTVVAKDPGSGLFDAHFGLILTQTPEVCTAGYQGTDTRIPQDGSNRPMNEDARCTEPASQSNARGGQHAPGRAAASYRAPVVGTYDRDKARVRYTDRGPDDDVRYTGGAESMFGEESWKWLLLQPLAED
ncbi:MAG: MlaD family protein, partial [Nocardioides sp.]